MRVFFFISPDNSPDARLFSMTYIQELCESVVDDFDLIDGEFGYEVVAEFVNTDDAVVVDVHHLEVGVDEHLKSLWESIVFPSDAALGYGFFEFVYGDLSVL